MRIVPVESAADETVYEAFLARHPGAMLYYTLAYRNLVRSHLGCDARYYVAQDDQGIVRGILPTMSRTGPYGRIINSLAFFGSHGGVLADSPHADAMLWDCWNGLAERVAAATVIMNPFAGQQPPIVWTHRDFRIGSMTPLPEQPDVESLCACIDASARRNYRKASRAGLDVREDNDGTDVLHAIHVENMESIGGRPKDLQFFRDISAHFTPGRDYKIYTARKDGDVIAALLVFLSGRCVEYFTPATRHEHRELQPSAALLICAMQDAVRAGYRFWNWGGTWASQQNVSRFKGKWGGQNRVYTYFTRVNAQELLAVTPSDLLAAYPCFYVYPFSRTEEPAI